MASKVSEALRQPKLTDSQTALAEWFRIVGECEERCPDPLLSGDDTVPQRTLDTFLRRCERDGGPELAQQVIDALVAGHKVEEAGRLAATYASRKQAQAEDRARRSR